MIRTQHTIRNVVKRLYPLRNLNMIGNTVAFSTAKFSDLPVASLFKKNNLTDVDFPILIAKNDRYFKYLPVVMSLVIVQIFCGFYLLLELPQDQYDQTTPESIEQDVSKLEDKNEERQRKIISSIAVFTCAGSMITLAMLVSRRMIREIYLQFVPSLIKHGAREVALDLRCYNFIPLAPDKQYVIRKIDIVKASNVKEGSSSALWLQCKLNGSDVPVRFMYPCVMVQEGDAILDVIQSAQVVEA
jgi:hypothetical protein